MYQAVSVLFNVAVHNCGEIINIIVCCRIHFEEGKNCAYEDGPWISINTQFTGALSTLPLSTLHTHAQFGSGKLN